MSVDEATKAEPMKPEPMNLQPKKTGMDRLADAVVALAALALVGLVAVQGWQVFARYVLNDSPSWTEPVTLVLLTSAMSFGAAAAVQNDRHFAFTLLADIMPGMLQRALFVFTKLTIALLGAVLAWWSFALLQSGLDVRTAGAPFPETLPYAPVALGGALMAIFALARCFSMPVKTASEARAEAK
jgi:TRAP-type C4-dicarboxylate transport system permease small subunit